MLRIARWIGIVALGATALACGDPDADTLTSATITSQGVTNRPPTVHMRRCGACDTGAQERDASGNWGKCTGEDTSLPRSPVTQAPVCGPYDDAIVFFAPHPDDETIGMAGAIRAAVTSGKRVFVEVMTRGEKSRARKLLGDHKTDSWHAGSHVYDLSEADFGEARVRETTESLARLGATGMHVNQFVNGKLTPHDVSTRIDAWLARGAGLDLRGTAGKQDPRSDGTLHPDHVAVWNALDAAAHGTSADRIHDVRGYCVYGYTSSLVMPDAIVDVHPWCSQKAAALSAFRKWDPTQGRYAIGEHSTPGLFSAASTDCFEMEVYP